MSANRFSALALAGPTPLDMLRALPSIRVSPLPFLEQCVDRFGDTVAFPVPGLATMLVNDPAGVRRVLVENAGNYTKATIQYRSLALVTGTGLLTADNPVWRRRRDIVQPAFRHGALPSFADAAARAAADLRHRWAQAPDQVLDADRALLEAMIGVVGRTLFDDDLADLGEQVVEAVDESLRVIIARAQSPIPARLALRAAARLRRTRAVIDNACATVIARHGLPASSASPPGDAEGNVLSLLLAAERAGVIDRQAVRDEMVTMIIAGHETVAAALTWALYLLAGNPHVQNEIAAELDAVLAGRSPGWDDLPKLAHTRAVLDETLRLYPPAWVITRRSVATDTVAGVDVPPGTLILISTWLVHRDARNFPDPTRFDPVRFLDGGGTPPISRRPSGSYLPFGVGPRLCIGRDAALAEGALMLAGLLQGRHVGPAPGGSTKVGADVGVDALITLRPRGGLPLRLVDRSGPRPS